MTQDKENQNDAAGLAVWEKYIILSVAFLIDLPYSGWQASDLAMRYGFAAVRAAKKS